MTVTAGSSHDKAMGQGDGLPARPASRIKGPVVGFVELLFLAVGLSMDACAVSICQGLSMKRLNLRHAVVIALFFGGFQALMPLVGWALGAQFSDYVASFGHWVAFGLLLFIGGKMLVDAFRGGEEAACEDEESKLEIGQLFMLAIATSIDALAVGISFAFLQVDIVPAVLTIGVATFLLSLGGVVVGNKFGARYEKPATIAGGIVLILIGCKILLEHLGFLG